MNTVSARKPFSRFSGRLATLLVPLLGAIAVCAGLDLVMVVWLSAGAPHGKNPTLFFEELTYLLAGSVLVLLVATLYPQKARSAIPWFFLFMAWHTGFQLSFNSQRPFTFSLIDLLLPLVLIVGLASRWHEPSMSPIVRPFLRIMLYFGAVCVWGLCLGIIREANPQPLLMNLKAFTLYPFILIVMVWCITSWRQLYVSLGLFIGFVTERAIVALRHPSGSGVTTMLQNGQIVSRANGDFASVNQYAFYIMSGLLLVVGIMVMTRSQRVRLVLAGPLLIMVSALLITFSRGSWVATAVGILALALLLRLKKVAALVAVIALVLVFVHRSEPAATSLVSSRFQTTNTDQSLTARQDFYTIGTEVVKHYPFGAGWGSAFVIGLYGLQPTHDPSSDWPWYHNDYLQLATQIGIPGLLLFLWIWWFILRQGYRSYRGSEGTLQAAIFAGLIASIVGMLVQANTDQFFWRTDIGPHPWIVAGLLLAGVRLLRRDRVADETPDVV